jgi:AcrR family transcriptional regulator
MTPQSDTREKLVHSALHLFLLQGYNATGISQILRKAEVNAGSLYHFFPTKEDLLLAVLEWYRDHIWVGLLEPVFTRIDDPFERVFGLLDGYRQMLVLTDFEQGCPIGNLALELTNSHEGARSLLIANFDNWQDAVGQCYRACHDRLPPDTDPAELARFTLALMEGGMLLARAYRSIEPFDSAVQTLRDYLERLQAEALDWSATGNEPRRRKD